MLHVFRKKNMGGYYLSLYLKEFVLYQKYIMRMIVTPHIQSSCVWGGGGEGGKCRDQVSRKKFHTHTYLI